MDALKEKIWQQLENMSEVDLQAVLDLLEFLEWRKQKRQQTLLSTTSKDLENESDAAWLESDIFHAEDSSALLLNLKNAIAYYQLGISQFQLKDYQQAVREFNQALQVNPNYAEAYYHRGKSLHKLNDKHGAIADFKKSAKLFCEKGLTEELASWTPFELGESSREEAINYLLQYLSNNSSYDEKRLAASAITKLASSFRTSCAVVIPYLLNNLSDRAPQVRQYVLKALNAINLPNSVIPSINAIAENDEKDYNRSLAQVILNKFR